jgi:hypothetical protein
MNEIPAGLDDSSLAAGDSLEVRTDAVLMVVMVGLGTGDDGQRFSTWPSK